MANEADVKKFKVLEGFTASKPLSSVISKHWFCLWQTWRRILRDASIISASTTLFAPSTSIGARGTVIAHAHSLKDLNGHSILIKSAASMVSWTVQFEPRFFRTLNISARLQSEDIAQILARKVATIPNAQVFNLLTTVQHYRQGHESSVDAIL
ncbi:hypothetical protein MVEG_12153 [Podila verticillata NRRL 6337]|uniref:Uncharacterized protein n=1 Tax=Podila verticillata NRRL 6337 TaxID=1069443 RepID=A0A086TJ72_9FUNG|nr:hypothetical protein MVEG_12153 [Podila verticillata NRRL 6337]